MAGGSGRRRTLADKLNYLFSTVRPPGEEREYTNSEVAAATNVSGSYIGYLRKGLRGNPSVDSVQALARFFGVRPSYFVDEEQDEERAASAEAQIRLFEALQNTGIKRLAMRAAEAELSPAALEAVAAMIDHVSNVEQTMRKDGRPGRARQPKPPSRSP